ncbi:MAG TPA: hypothetical protein VF686_06660 [Brevundimonas sp.]|jgi:hypothetical protein
MRTFTMIAVCAASLIAMPALAQQGAGVNVWHEGNLNDGSGVTAMGPNSGGLLATTPSRISSSRREMNRGRESNWARRPTPAQLRRSTELAIERGGLHCTIAEMDMVGQLTDGTPLVEVACQENGGVVIANSTPVQATDCFDLVGSTGVLAPCRIPANIALVEAALQSASKN